MKFIVTAGGQGTKLWPYSRQNKPKQFQPIIGDMSSYEQNIKTLLKEFAAEDIYISTKRKFIRYVSEQSPQIPLKNYIVEPDIAKDRGPAEGLAFLRLSLLHPNEPFFLVQADLLREPEDSFLRTVRAAEALVVKHRKYITGGIKATTPNMGADYLQLGRRISSKDVESYSVDHFHFRRDTLAETKQLIENFHVVAHWNHACWYPELMLHAYRQYRPDWYEGLMRIKEVLDLPGENEAIEDIYASMEKGPTEEVTKHVLESGEAMALLLPFKLTDVGTWGAVYDFFADDGQNYEDGNVVSVGATGMLMKSSNKTKLLAVAGVEDLVVVDTDDALLIVPRNKPEMIKDLQSAIKDRGQSEYL